MIYDVRCVLCIDFSALSDNREIKVSLRAQSALNSLKLKILLARANLNDRLLPNVSVAFGLV